MKILIIDDESLARDILESQLKKMEYNDITKAGDGKTALKIIKEEMPDLVFLDIRMPEMTGIELMEKAADINKNIIYIILSGYDLFEYAQRTMELGAYIYLLKPVDDSKLKQAMDKVENKLKVIRTEKEKYKSLNISNIKKQDLLKKQYIYKLLSGNSSNIENYYNHLQENPVVFKKNIFQIFFLAMKEAAYQTMEANNEDQELIQFGIENIINEITSSFEIDAYFFFDGEMKGVVINYNELEQTDSDTKKIYEVIYEKVQEFTAYFNQTKLTMGVGKSVQGLKMIQNAYFSAKETVNQRILKGDSSIYFANEETYPVKNNKNADLKAEEQIIRSMYQGDKALVKKYIDDLYLTFISAKTPNIKKLNKLHLNIFVLLHKELEKRGIQNTEILEDEILLYNKIQALDSIEETKVFLYTTILSCMEALNQPAVIGNEKIIMQAKEFIKENMGYNLSLETVSAHVNLSAVYFSKIFKTEEGMTFIDYVTKVRIEEAKYLLDENMKTTEICKRIGITDMKHFYKTFKKIQGVTPGQYKKRGN